MLCEYKDIFGKPREGVHSYRFMNVAIVDVLATVALSIAIGYFSDMNTFLIFLVLILVSIIAHKAFCVDTAVNRALFGKPT